MVSFSDRLPSVIHIRSVPMWRCQERCITFFFKSDSEWFYLIYWSKIGFQNARPLQVLSTMWMRTYVCRSIQLSFFHAEMSYLEVMSWNRYEMRMLCRFLMLRQSLPRAQLQETAKTNWERNSLVWQVSIDDPHVPSGELEVQRCFLEHWQSMTKVVVSVYCLFVSPTWKISNLMAAYFFQDEFGQVQPATNQL